MDMKRFFLYAIMIAALALAGCGGNGGGTAMGPDPDPDPPAQCPEGQVGTPPDCAPPGPTPEEMALKDAQDAAEAAYMAAMAAVAGAVDPVARQNAQVHVDEAKEANDAAQAATTSAMAEEHQMAAETARDIVIETAGTRGLEITNLANRIVNQQQIENAELEGRPAVAPRSNAERVGPAMVAAAGVVPVLNAAPAAPAVGTSVVQGSGGAVAADEAHAAVMRNVAGDITYVVTRGAGAVMVGEEPTPLETRGGWSGAELVRTDPAVAGSAPNMTYVNVYTDIQAPTQAYAPGATLLTDYTDTANAPAATTSTIVAGEVADDGGNFEVTVNVDPTDNMPPVIGQFQCAAGAVCTISVDANGRIVEHTGYTFHPRAGVATQDPDYLAWGVWLSVPGEVLATGAFPADATTTGVFGNGNDVFMVNAALKGRATYEGNATGLYSAAGMVEYFDADVMLEANFGGTVGADSTPGDGANDGLLFGAVTGTVSNIRAGGMDVDGSLALLRAPVLAAGPFAAHTDGILGGVTYRGEWGGQFYGPNNAIGAAIEDEFPTTAAGTFGAAAENGASILGAFGSWRAE